MATDRIRVELKGLDKIEKDFKRRGERVGPELHTGTQKAVLYMLGQMKQYPPPPPRSSYVRTGTLGRSIEGEVRALAKGPVGVLGTALKYAPNVIDEKRQAKVHRGRWWTMQGKVREHRDKIVAFLREGFLRALGL